LRPAFIGVVKAVELLPQHSSHLDVLYLGEVISLTFDRIDGVDSDSFGASTRLLRSATENMVSLDDSASEEVSLPPSTAPSRLEDPTTVLGDIWWLCYGGPEWFQSLGSDNIAVPARTPPGLGPELRSV